MDLLFQRYEELLVRRDRSESTVKNFRNIARQFNDWLIEQGLEAAVVTEDDIEDYLATLPFSRTTKKNHLVQIGAVYRRALRKGWGVKEDPTTDVELPAREHVEPKTLTTAQLRAISERITEERDWVTFNLFAFAGLRRIEVSRLLWEDVHLEEHWILVKGKGTKDFKQKLRQVPIHPALFDALEQYKPKSWARGEVAVIANARGIGLSPTRIHNRMKPLAPETKGTHDFRRTVASSLRRNKVDSSVIKRIMGWAPEGVFEQHYDHVTMPELHEAILRLYADDPL